MPRDGPVGHFGRSLGDHDHPRDVTSGLDALLGPALSPTAAKTAGQLSTQLTATLDEQGLVDRLVRDPHCGVVGKVHA